MGKTLDRSELAGGTWHIAEALARQLQAAEGSWTLEFEFEDGHLRRVYRHERLQPVGLRRFDVAGAVSRLSASCFAFLGLWGWPL